MQVSGGGNDVVTWPLTTGVAGRRIFARVNLDLAVAISGEYNIPAHFMIFPGPTSLQKSRTHFMNTAVTVRNFELSPPWSNLMRIFHCRTWMWICYSRWHASIGLRNLVAMHWEASVSAGVVRLWIVHHQFDLQSSLPLIAVVVPVVQRFCTIRISFGKLLQYLRDLSSEESNGLPKICSILPTETPF